jgi:hypothetical protein
VSDILDHLVQRSNMQTNQDYEMLQIAGQCPASSEGSWWLTAASQLISSLGSFFGHQFGGARAGSKRDLGICYGLN